MNERPHSLYLKITPIPSERTFNQFLHKNLSVQKRCGRCFSTIFCTKEKCIFGIFQPENAQFIFGVLLQNLFSTEFCGFPFKQVFWSCENGAGNERGVKHLLFPQGRPSVHTAGRLSSRTTGGFLLPMNRGGCAKRRRQQTVNLLQTKHRRFESFSAHFFAFVSQSGRGNRLKPGPVRVRIPPKALRGVRRRVTSAGQTKCLCSRTGICAGLRSRVFCGFDPRRRYSCRCDGTGIRTRPKSGVLRVRLPSPVLSAVMPQRYRASFENW